MMKTYEIKGFGKYAGYEDIIYSPAGPQIALKSFLIYKKIKYRKIIKLTNKVNKELMDKGINPVDAIEFTVCEEGNYNPSARGNYRIE